MIPQGLAVLVTLVSFAPHGNRIAMELDRGSAELVWISPANFHFRRSLNGPLAASARPEPQTDPVKFTIDDTPAALRLRTAQIDVSIGKHGLLVSVRRADGSALMADLSEPAPQGLLVSWDREAAPGVRFYGLGGIADPTLDLRGKVVDSPIPLLISTAGYGEYHPGMGAFRFDFTPSGRYRITAPQVDYYFYFGPSPKQIFEAHKGVGELPLLAERPHPASWEGLRDDLLAAVHQAISSQTLPRFRLAAYAGAGEDLLQRARQFGSLLPAVDAGVVPLSALRKQLESFYDIYEIETRDHGRPIFHALPFQFPDDPECANHADEFLLGDELLIAPIYQPGNSRQVYLPPGRWTSLENNREYPGSSTIPVSTAALPVFARNGAIVPLDSAGGIGLHYFPSAGGEFFLLEKDLGAYTQVHAAPAGDAMRLEIESKKERDYQWVIHNVERPTAVASGESNYTAAASVAALANRTWFYDAASKNLIVRVKVSRGEDSILHLSW